MSQQYRSLLISRVAPDAPPGSADGTLSAKRSSAGLVATRLAPAAIAAVAVASGHAAEAQSTLPVPALLSGFSQQTAAGPNCGTPAPAPTGTYCPASPLEASHYLYMQNTTEVTSCQVVSSSCGYWGISTCTTTNAVSGYPANPMTFGYQQSAGGGIAGDQNAIWYNSGDTLRLSTSGSSTMTLNNPERVNHVYIFESTGSAGGNGIFSATFNFSNGAQITQAVGTNDWWTSNGQFVNGENAGGAYGTATTSNNGGFQSSGWYSGVHAYVHEYEFNPGEGAGGLSAPLLDSITFTVNGGATGFYNFWGVSTTAVTPSPPGLALAIAGMLLSGTSVLRNRKLRVPVKPSGDIPQAT